MFFHIGQQPKENFPEHRTLGSFSVSTDPGWHQVSLGHYDIIYKGYADSGLLAFILDKIVQQKEPMLTGNFCAFVYDNVQKKLLIKTDRYRSFPIYIGDGTVTNLIPADRVGWTNSLISINSDWSIAEDKFNVIGKFSTDESTIDQIDQLITKKIGQFARYNTRTVKVFLSGGVDTLLVYSYIRRLGIPHELVWSSHIDHDDFWLANHNDIQKYWAYSQIHYWQDPCTLASGAPGDEFMLRSPKTANMYLLHQGASIPELLKQNPNVLHREYFLRRKHLDLFAQQLLDFRPEDQLTVNWNMCNILVNDWQHWHIGNTLTWTPLRDVELFKLFLQLPRDLARAQIMDSAVSRQLIEQNVPGLTTVISDQKNSGNYMKNLVALLK